MIIKNGEVFQEDGSFRLQDLYVENHRIVASEDEVTDKTIVDAAGLRVLPGLVDIHSHGAFGHDFSDADPEGLKIILKYEKSHGITSYCPTSMTLPAEELKEIFATIKTVGEMKDGAAVRGINMEGPFLDAKKKGAHVEGYIRKPDARFFRELNEYSGNMVKLVTLAPNVDGAMEFIDEVHNEVCISLGHTAADYDTAAEAMRRGAHHVTHLYNAQRGLNHREPGVTGYGLLTDGVKAEMICDGIHIKPKMVYMAYKVKGSDGIELITDSMRAKGMPEGKSELGGQTVYVKDGTARLEDGTIAGSVLTYIDAFRNIMKFTDASLKEAVQMSSGNQAKEFGLTQKGEITVGKDADFVILENSQDGNYELKKTISMGEIIEA